MSVITLCMPYCKKCHVDNNDQSPRAFSYLWRKVFRASALSSFVMLSASALVARGFNRTLATVSLRRALCVQSIRSSSEAKNKQSQYRPNFHNTRSFSLSAASTQLDSPKLQDELELDPYKLRDEWGKASFDVSQMTFLLDHDNQEKRAKFRKILSEDPLMTPKYNISIDEERELALKRLKKLCDQGFISVLDFRNNPLWIFAAHELAAVVDAAMTTKMTVQFNLFGGTVLKLGTERHHDKLLKVMGRFPYNPNTIGQRQSIVFTVVYFNYRRTVYIIDIGLWRNLAKLKVIAACSFLFLINHFTYKASRVLLVSKHEGCFPQSNKGTRLVYLWGELHH